MQTQIDECLQVPCEGSTQHHAHYPHVTLSLYKVNVTDEKQPTFAG